MGLFNFFRKNNPKENILDDLYSGLEIIADSSYKVFLESFDFNKIDFGEATKFETYIATLFYIDYGMSNEDISLTIRKNFYKLAKIRIIERFSNTPSDANLSDIVDDRYYGYSKIPMKIGRDWQQSFNNVYEMYLKGTEKIDTIGKLPRIKDEGIFEQIPKKVRFIRDETGNLYKAAKLVKELFAGKSLNSIIKEIEKTDLKIKREFREGGL